MPPLAAMAPVTARHSGWAPGPSLRWHRSWRGTLGGLRARSTSVHLLLCGVVHGCHRPANPCEIHGRRPAGCSHWPRRTAQAGAKPSGVEGLRGRRVTPPGPRGMRGHSLPVMLRGFSEASHMLGCLVGTPRTPASYSLFLCPVTSVISSQNSPLTCHLYSVIKFPMRLKQ